MNRHFRSFLLATVAASVGLLLNDMGDSAQAMTLKDAVGLAVTSNPEVGVVSNDRRAIDQELRQGRALYYPQIDVRGATGAEYSDNVTTEEEDEQGHRTLWRKEASLTVSQLLFDGFFADSEVERQASRVKSAAFRVYESAEFVGLDAIEAYLEVQRHRERLENSEENVAVHQSRLGQVQQRADAGGGNIADVRQAEARLANAESDLIQTQGNLRDAEALFIRVVGQTPDTLEPAVFPGEYMPADSEQAVQAAVENSPTVAFARQDVKTAEAEVKQQEASLYPDFRLELGAAIGDDVDGRTVTEYDAQAMVVMRYNLYRGGADTARIREFKWRQAEAIDQLRVFEREAAENARVSWNAVEVSRGNVEILEREVQANINTVEVYKQQFEIGQRGLLDLLDADNELFLSQDSLITARYAETFANFRLLATQGALQKSLGVTAPDAATIYQD